MGNKTFAFHCLCCIAGRDKCKKVVQLYAIGKQAIVKIKVIPGSAFGDMMVHSKI